MLEKKFWIEESKKIWFTETDHSLDVETVKAGCLMRIATATEAMAQNYKALIDERDRYKRYYEEQKRRAETLERQNAALRGHLTRRKKRGR